MVISFGQGLRVRLEMVSLSITVVHAISSVCLRCIVRIYSLSTGVAVVADCRHGRFISLSFDIKVLTHSFFLRGENQLEWRHTPSPKHFTSDIERTRDPTAPTGGAPKPLPLS